RRLAMSAPVTIQKPMPAALATVKLMATSWNGGTVPVEAVSSASSAHSSTATNPIAVAVLVSDRVRLSAGMSLMAASACQVLSAIGGERRTGDEPRLVVTQEGDAVGDLVGRAQPVHRDCGNDAGQHLFRYRRHHVGVDIT